MPRQAKVYSWEDYYIPGTHTLRNKFTSLEHPYGEPDPDKLRMKEEAFTASRLEELHAKPVEGGFDYEHMKAIHRYIFQDVYEWAGQERTAPVGSYMLKAGPDVVNYPVGDTSAPLVNYGYYPAGPELTKAARVQYRRIAEMDYLRGMGLDEFVHNLAEVWGDLNVVHSFREGNTRSQFTFFSQLALQAGYVIDTHAYAPGQALRDEFVAGRFYSQATGSNALLEAGLAKGIHPIGAVDKGYEQSLSLMSDAQVEGAPPQESHMQRGISSGEDQK